MGKHGTGTPIADTTRDQQKLVDHGYVGKHEVKDTPKDGGSKK